MAIYRVRATAVQASLDELTEAVADREDALSDVNLQVDALDMFGSRAFVELGGYPAGSAARCHRKDL